MHQSFDEFLEEELTSTTSLQKWLSSTEGKLHMEKIAKEIKYRQEEILRAAKWPTDKKSWWSNK